MCMYTDTLAGPWVWVWVGVWLGLGLECRGINKTAGIIGDLCTLRTTTNSLCSHAYVNALTPAPLHNVFINSRLSGVTFEQPISKDDIDGLVSDEDRCRIIRFTAM